MYQFIAYGHPNISALHRGTLEFTCSEDLTEAGDCIVGVRATYDLEKLKAYLLHEFDFRMHIIVGDESITLNAQYNVEFNDTESLVIRRSLFKSDRTLGIAASHSAMEMPRTMVMMMQDPRQEIKVYIEKTTE